MSAAATSKLRMELASDDVGVRMSALRRLVALAAEGRNVSPYFPLLLETGVLGAPNASVRICAGRVLQDCVVKDEEWEPVLDLLARVLAEDPAPLRSASLELVHHLAPPIFLAFCQRPDCGIDDCLLHEEPSVRVAAVRVLARFLMETRDPSLSQKLSDNIVVRCGMFASLMLDEDDLVVFTAFERFAAITSELGVPEGTDEFSEFGSGGVRFVPYLFHLLSSKLHTLIGRFAELAMPLRWKLILPICHVALKARPMVNPEQSLLLHEEFGEWQQTIEELLADHLVPLLYTMDAVTVYEAGRGVLKLAWHSARESALVHEVLLAFDKVLQSSKDGHAGREELISHLVENVMRVDAPYRMSVLVTALRHIKQLVELDDRLYALRRTFVVLLQMALKTKQEGLRGRTHVPASELERREKQWEHEEADQGHPDVHTLEQRHLPTQVDALFADEWFCTVWVHRITGDTFREEVVGCLAEVAHMLLIARERRALFGHSVDDVPQTVVQAVVFDVMLLCASCLQWRFVYVYALHLYLKFVAYMASMVQRKGKWSLRKSAPPPEMEHALLRLRNVLLSMHNVYAQLSAAQTHVLWILCHHLSVEDLEQTNILDRVKGRLLPPVDPAMRTMPPPGTLKKHKRASKDTSVDDWSVETSALLNCVLHLAIRCPSVAHKALDILNGVTSKAKSLIARENCEIAMKRVAYISSVPGSAYEDALSHMLDYDYPFAETEHIPPNTAKRYRLFVSSFARTRCRLPRFTSASLAAASELTVPADVAEVAAVEWRKPPTRSTSSAINPVPLLGPSDPCHIDACHTIDVYTREITLCLRLFNQTSLDLEKLKLVVGMRGKVALANNENEASKYIHQLTTRGTARGRVDWNAQLSITGFAINTFHLQLQFETQIDMSAAEGAAGGAGAGAGAGGVGGDMGEQLMDDDDDGGDESEKRTEHVVLHALPYRVPIKDFLVPEALPVTEFLGLWTRMPIRHVLYTRMKHRSAPFRDTVKAITRESQHFGLVFDRVYGNKGYEQVALTAKTWWEDVVVITVIATFDPVLRAWSAQWDLRTSSKDVLDVLRSDFASWFGELTNNTVIIMPRQEKKSVFHSTSTELLTQPPAELSAIMHDRWSRLRSEAHKTTLPPTPVMKIFTKRGETPLPVALKIDTPAALGAGGFASIEEGEEEEDEVASASLAAGGGASTSTTRTSSPWGFGLETPVPMDSQPLPSSLDLFHTEAQTPAGSMFVSAGADPFRAITPTSSQLAFGDTDGTSTSPGAHSMSGRSSTMLGASTYSSSRSVGSAGSRGSADLTSAFDHNTSFSSAGGGSTASMDVFQLAIAANQVTALQTGDADHDSFSEAFATAAGVSLFEPIGTGGTSGGADASVVPPMLPPKKNKRRAASALVLGSSTGGGGGGAGSTGSSPRSPFARPGSAAVFSTAAQASPPPITAAAFSSKSNTTNSSNNLTGSTAAGGFGLPPPTPPKKRAASVAAPVATRAATGSGAASDGLFGSDPFASMAPAAAPAAAPSSSSSSSSSPFEMDPFSSVAGATSGASGAVPAATKPQPVKATPAPAAAAAAAAGGDGLFGADPFASGAFANSTSGSKPADAAASAFTLPAPSASSGKKRAAAPSNNTQGDEANDPWAAF